MNASARPLSVDAHEALYFFCLARSTPWTAEHAGMSGNGLHVLSLGNVIGDAAGVPICAVVDIVEREAWTGPEASDNMQSLEWVGTRATLHEEVVEQAMQHGPVYPARFGTLYSSFDRLVDTAHAHRSELSAFMERVSHADEWALKMFVDRDRAATHLSAKEKQASPTSGTAYLKQKQREKEARSAVDTWLQEVSDALYDRLQNAGIREIEVLDPRRAVLASPDETLALNWALLVGRSDQNALREVIQQTERTHADHGLSFRLTGPWPPYTFRPLMSQRDESASPRDAA